ncbi:hypothetical protein BE04_15930 [Sorangium cellulosum]|uniref:Uncharacterized protein n=2 Tax=Sorangium cellulosum TaxID=56 RepID=A0A150PFY7_SORCE|nr:hypothetical protein [Sorangium cellulosum]AGP41777.1 hypothetical protein SCE1572_49200 [Sorangium cellulosum So0157-2]KYF54585.1 hypothetical protein BE04_15930 [Sorangium cellulosum]
MDEQKIQEIKKEAARQAAVGASGGRERPDEHEAPSDMPKPPVAIEASTAAQEDGDRQPNGTGNVPAVSREAERRDGPTQGAPAVRPQGDR